MSETVFDAFSHPLDERQPTPAPITLAEDFRCSESIGKLVEALSKAQLEFLPIKKTVENKFYSTAEKKSMYADLAGVIAATQKHLAENGLVVIQWPVIDHASRMAGTCSRLAHTSGEWTQCTILLPATEKRKEYAKDGSYSWKDQFTAQTCGIAITYSRRYSYQGAIGVAAEEDDDGNRISVNENGSTEVAQAVGERKVAVMKQRVAQQAAEKEAEPSGTNGHATPQEAPDEIYGVLKAAKKIKLKNNKGDALVLTIVDPNDEPKEIFCFDNHQFPIGTKLFDILEMAADGNGQSIRGRIKQTGKFTNLIWPIAIGNVNFDEDGPIMDRTGA